MVNPRPITGRETARRSRPPATLAAAREICTARGGCWSPMRWSEPACALTRSTGSRTRADGVEPDIVRSPRARRRLPIGACIAFRPFRPACSGPVRTAPRSAATRQLRGRASCDRPVAKKACLHVNAWGADPPRRRRPEPSADRRRSRAGLLPACSHANVSSALAAALRDAGFLVNPDPAGRDPSCAAAEPPTDQPTRSWRRCRRPRGSGLMRHSCATTTCPPPSIPRFSTWPAAMKADRSSTGARGPDVGGSVRSKS